MIVTSVMAVAIAGFLVAGWLWYLDMRQARDQLKELAGKYEKRVVSRQVSAGVVSSLDSSRTGTRKPAATASTPAAAPRTARPGTILLANILKPETFPKSAAAIIMSDAEPDTATQDEANNIMQQYRQARTWREKLPLVRDPAHVEPLMRDFYEVQKGTDPVCDKVDGVVGFHYHGVEVVLLSHANPRANGKVEAALLRDESGALKLDWESFVGYSDMEWAAYRKARPVEHKVFRAFAATGDYWNYEFGDQSKYLSVRLLSPDGMESLHGFCERNSGVGREMASVLSRSSEMQAMTLRLAFPEKAESDQCVRIVGLVAERWLLPP